MIGQNIAPGTNRDFSSEQWPWIAESVWDQVREEAEDLAKYDQPLDITGSRYRSKHGSCCRGKTQLEAGFVDLIKWEQQRSLRISIFKD